MNTVYGVRKGSLARKATPSSLKVNLDEYLEDAELFCTDNADFNNGVQVPRSSVNALPMNLTMPDWWHRDAFARLSVNDFELGIYARRANQEVVPARRFGNDGGDHHEGTLSDFTDLIIKCSTRN